MSFKLYQVAGFKPAIEFMRKPLKSYAKADSDFSQSDGPDFEIGPVDYDLAKRLWKGGPVHRKWLRMVYAWIDIEAPLYFWSEFDTYQHITKNSESTLHTIQKEDFDNVGYCLENCGHPAVDEAHKHLIPIIQSLQNEYYDAKTAEEKNHIRLAIKDILPTGYIQRRGVCLNYETIALMYDQRKDHRLPIWSVDFVDFCKSLPKSEFITGEFAE